MASRLVLLLLVAAHGCSCFTIEGLHLGPEVVKRQFEARVSGNDYSDFYPDPYPGEVVVLAPAAPAHTFQAVIETRDAEILIIRNDGIDVKLEPNTDTRIKDLELASLDLVNTV